MAPPSRRPPAPRNAAAPTPARAAHTDRLTAAGAVRAGSACGAAESGRTAPTLLPEAARKTFWAVTLLCALSTAIARLRQRTNRKILEQ